MSVAPALLVNGLPGAGKSSLARVLSRELGLPLFAKDAVKEAHADVLGAEPPAPGMTQRQWNAALGAAASETLWALLAAAPGGAVLDSCWPVPARPFVVRGLRRAPGLRPLEVWCEVPLATARRRCEARHPRHPVHGAPPSEEEWAGWARDARPTEAAGPVLRVDTAGPVDTVAVLTWIRRRLRD